MRTFCGIIAGILFIAFQAAAQAPGGSTPGGSTPGGDASAPGSAEMSAMQNYQRGRELESQGRAADASAYYNQAVRVCLDEVSRNSATRTTYTVITWALQRQSRYAEVISWGERGLRIYPDEYRIVETMGEAYFYLRNYERSLTFMQRYANALPEGERISVAYFFIGEIFRLRRSDTGTRTLPTLPPCALNQT